MDAHEKQLRLRIAELRRIDDIASMLGQKSRYAMHDAALIGAGQGQYVGMIHRNELSQVESDWCGCAGRPVAGACWQRECQNGC